MRALLKGAAGVCCAVLAVSAWAGAGFSASGVCFSTIGEAVDYRCKTWPSGVVYASTTPYTYACDSWQAGADFGLFYLGRTTLGSGPANPGTTYFYTREWFKACDTDENPPSDSDQVDATVAVFGLGLAFLALVWGSRRLYSALSYGRKE